MFNFSTAGLYQFPFAYQKVNTLSYPWMCLQSPRTKLFVLALGSVVH